MNDFTPTALNNALGDDRSFVTAPDPIVVPFSAENTIPTFAINIAGTSVTEGNQVVVDVTTTNISNGTRLFITPGSGGSAVAGDFTNTIWYVVINNNKGRLRLIAKEDYTVEASETLQLQLRTTRATGPVVATSNTITVVDKALPPAPAPLPTRTRVLTAAPPVPAPPSNGTPSYSIYVDPIALREFKANGLQIYTTNVPDSTLLFVTINDESTATYADFVNFPLQTTVANNNASRSIYTVNDGLTETETLRLDLRTGSFTGPVVATTPLMTVSDPVTGGGGGDPEEQIPTYVVTVSPSTVNEGSSVTATVTTTFVPNNTVMYLAVDRFTSAGALDLVGSPWAVTIVNNTATATIQVTADNVEEAAESFRLTLHKGSPSSRILAISNSVSINNTVLAPTYQISLSASTINEGASFTGTITTTNVPNNTRLYVTVAGTGTATEADFDGAPWPVYINNNTGQFTGRIRADNLTEGAEAGELHLRTISPTGAIVATSSPLLISDTSLTPAISYNMVATPNPVNEGAILTVNVTTTGVPNGTTLHASLNSGTTATSNDVSAFQWAVTINNNVGVFAANIVSDLITEGVETIQFILKPSISSTEVVATSNLVNINDTSNGGGGGGITYAFVLSPSSVTEGTSFTGLITTSGVANGTYLYVTADGSGSASADDFNAASWRVTINNNSGSFSGIAVADNITEGVETKVFYLRTGSYTGPLVATASITINNTGTGGGGSGYSTISVIEAPATVPVGSWATIRYAYDSPYSSGMAMISYTVDFVDDNLDVNNVNQIQIQYRALNGSVWSQWYDGLALGGMLWVDEASTEIQVRALADRFLMSQTGLRFRVLRGLATNGTDVPLINYVTLV